jgi:sugar (pentulose or hexulose) kinase
LREKGKDSSSIQALSCDSTSGTVLALDREGRTLSRAIMLMMEERTKKQKS